MNAKTRKLLFYLISIFIVYGIVELSAGIIWGIKNRDWQWPGQIASVYFPKTYGIEGCQWSDQVAVHPYLGFNYGSPSACATVPINQFGMPGPEIPIEKQKDVFSVLVLGGSVAESLAAHIGAAGGVSVLQNLVSEKFKSVDGRPIQVLNASIAAGAQPMQIMEIVLYAQHADAIISVEGYNEFQKLSTQQTFFRPPILWQDLLNRDFIPVGFKGIYMFLAQRYYRLVRESSVLKKSFLFVQTAIFFERISDRYRHKAFASQKYPDVNFIESYRRSLAFMGAMAEVQKIGITVFWQPVPALFKNLTDREKKIVGSTEYGDEYQNMISQVQGKYGQNFDAVNLLSVFQNTPDEIYTDQIHNNMLGKEILATAIIDKLAKKYKWKRY